VATTPSSAMLPLSTSACAARNARAGSTLCAPRPRTQGRFHTRMPGMISSCAGAPLRSLPGRRTLGLELSMRAALWRARHLGQAPGGREARPSNTLFGAWVCPMVSGRPAAQARAP